MIRAKLISSHLSLLGRSVRVTRPSSQIIYSRSRRTNDYNLRHLSSHSIAPTQEVDTEEGGPKGDLFHSPIDDTLLNKTASIRRTFSPRSNAQVMLTCGGASLAAHASWDPQYSRAKSYIRSHAVGPAVLSPVLINGLVGALVEASLPQGFLISCHMKQHRPLIVGVQVEATISVTSVTEGGNMAEIDTSYEYLNQSRGYELVLQTQVKSVSDGTLISEGSQNIWLPHYDA
eukprot:CAMPEP_0198250134 /NCGR_PEP_ID=MMETSP1447-20131203/1435_1 /TAXON_ID=420782 /ORGANISM="Chaetoceros dichaeta, Strain CCMP1751" /LENGTH=230 /DNA_ID=CAMNT_0043934923 /DNA_START=9 /DNA_END=701 /DNA_ORIENTATION=-